MDWSIAIVDGPMTITYGLTAIVNDSRFFVDGWDDLANNHEELANGPTSIADS